MENLNTIDIEKLEKLGALVYTHGLAVTLVLLFSITAIPALFVLLYRNLTELKKTQYATIKMLEKMMLNYKWDDETFKTFARYAAIDIRWNVQNYIITKIKTNHIKENFELFIRTAIQSEAQTEIDKHINEFKTTNNNKLQFRNMVEKEIINANKIIFSTFEEQIKKDEIIHENLIYAVDKAMNEFQSDVMTVINKLF